MTDPTGGDLPIVALLEAWLDEARATIHARLPELVVPIGMARWQATEIGGFRRYPFYAIYHHSRLDTAIFENSSIWPEVAKLADSLEKFKKHMGQLVGSPSGMARVYSLQDLCKSMLPDLAVTENQSIIFDGDWDVITKVKGLLEAINSDYIEQSTIWPIRGLQSYADIRLDSLTQFRELSVEEKLVTLNFDIIRPDFQMEIAAEQARWFGLCRKCTDIKVFGERDFDPSVVSKRFVESEQVLEDFLVSVPLATDRIAYHAGGYQSAPHFETGSVLQRGAIGRNVGLGHDMRFMLVDEETKLTAQNASRLCEVWKFIRGNKSSKFAKRVNNAARRLFYAETRSKYEDVLIDLMIAAESLYLDIESNELSFRMSLHAAFWADVERAEKKRIFRDFKDAYNLRSKIVHGSEVNVQSVTDSVSLIKPPLRDGIRKALAHLGQRSTPPDWQTMLFEADFREDRSGV